MHSLLFFITNPQGLLRGIFLNECLERSQVSVVYPIGAFDLNGNLSVAQYEVYFQTGFRSPEMDWVDDGMRFGKDDRWRFFSKVINELEDRNFPYTVISGKNFSLREEQARKAIRNLIFPGIGGST